MLNNFHISYSCLNTDHGINFITFQEFDYKFIKLKKYFYLRFTFISKFSARIKIFK